MSNSPMIKTSVSKTIRNIFFAQPSHEVYSVFQSEGDPLSETGTRRDSSPSRTLGAMGFFGRVLEGTGIVAFSLAITIVTMTTGAWAQTQSMLSSATGDYATATMVAMMAVFAIMLALLRKIWRQTGKTIDQAPRSSHRIS